jgi:hypothetical protein
MRKLALLVAIILLYTIPVLSQVKTRQAVMEKPVLRTRAVVGPQADSIFTADVAAMFDKMEQNVEMQFAKIKKDIKDDILKLNDAIKQVPANLVSLRKQLNKLEAELGKVNQLQARFIIMMDSIRQSPGGGLLNGDRVKMQARMDSLSTQRISIQDQVRDLNGRIAMQTALNNEEIKKYQNQIALLEQESAEAEKHRNAMIVDLRKEKLRVLAQLARLIKEKQMTTQEYQSTITTMVNNYADVLQQALQRAGRSQL